MLGLKALFCDWKRSYFYRRYHISTSALLLILKKIISHHHYGNFCDMNFPLISSDYHNTSAKDENF